ncbi:MAG: PLP-dependent aminotransferase family protein [Methylotenera sp.]|nr:PLP-dependent aminotransferase family protein [Methylotenera sp.]
MKNTPNNFIRLDQISTTPLYLQIYERFREVIAKGLLKPGDRVPSLRNLSSELNVARGTVEAAYEMLVGEGLFLPRGQAGTVIAPSLKTHSYALQHQLNKSETILHRVESEVANSPQPFQLGLPALDAFPRKLWSKIGCHIIKSASARDMNYPDNKGLFSLRHALAGYLNVSRGILCKPSQIIITDGYRGSLSLISRAYIKANDQVWMEDPGYFATRNLLGAIEVKVIPVPVDDQGIIVEYGLSRAPRAVMAIVTPSHQSPLGVTLSLSRRLELLRWASENMSWIVEDDYDGEYRYTSRPLPALKSLDNDDRVIYAGTFSKVLSPALRLAYIVVPESQVAHFESVCEAFQNGCPWLTQATVAEFILEGHFSRHLKKMRALYCHRRSLLVDALKKSFAEQIQISLQAGGMHLVIRFNQQYDDQYLAKHLNESGLAVHSLSSWSTKHDCGHGLLIGFTNIHSAEYAEMLVGRMKNIINAN